MRTVLHPDQSLTIFTVMKKNSLQQSVEAAEYDFSRRHFLKMAGITALGIPFAGFADIKATGVSIIVDPADPIANSVPAQWATGELETALKTQGIKVQRCTSITKANAGNLCIPVAGASSAVAKPIIKSAGVTVPAATEALGLIPGKSTTRPTISTLVPLFFKTLRKKRVTLFNYVPCTPPMYIKLLYYICVTGARVKV